MSKSDVKDWRIAVVGAGTMGLSIAQLFATYGHEVDLYNRTPANLDKAMGQIRSNLKTMADLGEIKEADIPAILARIHGTSDLAASVARAEYIIENVAERQDVKEKIFAEIDRNCREDAIIASNTSTMNIFEFIKVRRPDRLVISHFFLPAYVIPLIELVRGPDTSDETVAEVKALLESVGKETAVLNQVIPGFIINRITLAIFREVNYIAGMGYATPEDIDKALVSVYGPRYTFEGPFALCDFAGVDIYERLAELLYPQLCNATECPQVIHDMVKAGDLGVKSGKGFYPHTDTAGAASRRNAKITKMIQAIRKTNQMFEQES